MGRIEDAARALRQATGGDLEQLEFLFAGKVATVRAPGPMGLCVHRPDGRALLLLPVDPEAAAHEWAHALLHVGLGDQLRRAGVPTWRRQHRIEEAQADRWAAAYLEVLEVTE